MEQTTSGHYYLPFCNLNPYPVAMHPLARGSSSSSRSTNSSFLFALFAASAVCLISSVSPAVAGEFQNISTRGYISGGDIALIGGFIITGQTPKKVVLRALGPSLDLAESAQLIPDPVLELHKPDGTVVTNDDWRETQEQEIVTTGLAPVNDLESAIVTTLPAGAYTAVVRGKGISDDSSGNAVLEVYDLGQAADSILANISSRGFTAGDKNELIGGIILGPAGTGDSTLVVRGLGPSLFIQDGLYDPTIEIYNSEGATIGFNDNWGDGPEAGEIAALRLNPIIDREAALEVTLAPGAYTVILRGTGVEVDLTGIGLVEAYHVR